MILQRKNAETPSETSEGMGTSFHVIRYPTTQMLDHASDRSFPQPAEQAGSGVNKEEAEEDEGGRHHCSCTVRQKSTFLLPRLNTTEPKKAKK
jgi:hypothetical protein